MNYALVVYQNQDLQSIGLNKLTVLKNGGVRIAENSKLCYTRSVAWNEIMVGNLRDVIIDNGKSWFVRLFLFYDSVARLFAPSQNWQL